MRKLEGERERHSPSGVLEHTHTIARASYYIFRNSVNQFLKQLLMKN